jgi:hypothetical protein
VHFVTGEGLSENVASGRFGARICNFDLDSVEAA